MTPRILQKYYKVSTLEKCILLVSDLWVNCGLQVWTFRFAPTSSFVVETVLWELDVMRMFSPSPVVG